MQPDGSLRCLNQEPDVPQDTVFAPCCVVFAPLGGPRGQPQQQQQSRGTQRKPREVYYLVVRWPDVQVDPSVWGFGPDLGLLQYAVREATRRLVEFKCKSQPGWVPDKGLPLSCLRGRDPTLPPEWFDAKWQQPGMLYTLAAGAGPRLVLPGNTEGGCWVVCFFRGWLVT